MRRRSAHKPSAQIDPNSPEDAVVELGDTTYTEDELEFQPIEEAHHGDMVDVCRRSTRRFPLIIADVPYNRIVKDEWDSASMTDYARWATTLQSVAEPGAALYWFGGWGNYKNRLFFRFLSKIEDHTNWHLQALIPWVKKRGYGVQDNYLAALEFIGYFTLGPKPRMFNKPYLAVERTCREWTERKCHSTLKRRTMVWDDVGDVVDVTEILRAKSHSAEKPIKLFNILIETHTEKGETILDPFAGSGASGEAARKLGRGFVLIEKLEENYRLIVKRLGLAL